MRGFWSGLSPEQKKAALEYRGPENHGDPETHEQRSCLRKRRFSDEPTDEVKGDYFYAYECGYCGGWHLATSAKRRNGDLRYTKEGWPVVPYCPPKSSKR